MIVYILWFNNFQGGQDFVGIYSSREAAEERMSHFSENDQQQFEIEEWGVDQ